MPLVFPYLKLCWVRLRRIPGDRQCREVSKHVAILYFVTLLLILPAICFKYRFSVYHIKTRTKEGEINFMKAENTARVNKALRTIQAYRDSSIANGREGSSAVPRTVDVAITIITLSRNRHKFSTFEPKYLTQMVSAYLQLLSTNEAKLKTYKLYMCNVDSDPSTYFEFKNLTNIVPSFQRFSNQARLDVADVFAKEKDDYVYCLNQTLQTGAKNVLLVEDDALPLDDLMMVVNHVIDTFLYGDLRETTHHVRKEQAPVYIKLYHPDRLLGYWSPEFDRIPQLFAFGSLWGSVLFIVYQRFSKFRVNSYLLWAVFSLYFILVAVAIGRQNLLEWRRLSKHFYLYTRAASCCTPAILYPREGGRRVTEYLSQVASSSTLPKDTALDTFRYTTGAKAFMIQPNLFKHIGLISSLRDQILNPFSV